MATTRCDHIKIRYISRTEEECQKYKHKFKINVSAGLVLRDSLVQKYFIALHSTDIWWRNMLTILSVTYVPLSAFSLTVKFSSTNLIMYD